MNPARTGDPARRLAGWLPARLPARRTARVPPSTSRPRPKARPPRLVERAMPATAAANTRAQTSRTKLCMPL